ncbi:MAG: MBL fold metallo-hydrolase [Candidatus Lokiarchaeota archaeon]|nr:MBL fold metallo-hydrolase [Candidatus Lokiarchaeota archaeon]
MKEVIDGIYLIQEKSNFGVIKPTENIYVIAGKNGLIFDAGYGTRSAIRFLLREINHIKTKYTRQGIFFKLTRALPSHIHPDHFSGLKALRDQLRIKIILTDKMAQTINNKENFYAFFEDSQDHAPQRKDNTKKKFKEKLRKNLYRSFYRFGYGINFISDPDEIVDEETIININGDEWRIFPSPGHSFDHLSLYNEEKGILFSGDNILYTTTTWLGPPSSDVQDYIKSLKYIYNLKNLKLILPAHGPLIKHPKERIREILSHREKRSNQVLELVQNHPKGISTTRIVNNLYPGASRFFIGIARGWIFVTLKMLIHQDHVRCIPGKEDFFFQPNF